MVVPVAVDSAAAYSALDLDVRYDPAQLTPIGVQRVGQARQALVEASVRSPGLFLVSLASSEPLAGGTVMMLRLDTTHGARAPLHLMRAAVDGVPR